MAEKVMREEWQKGERIPSAREIAIQLQVNPNTAMRAYEGLQNDEILFYKRGIGFFVSEDARQRIIIRERMEFISEVLPAVFSKMELLGLTAEDIQKEYEQYKHRKQ